MIFSDLRFWQAQGLDRLNMALKAQYIARFSENDSLSTYL
jgi:hypothetical protein